MHSFVESIWHFFNAIILLRKLTIISTSTNAKQERDKETNCQKYNLKQGTPWPIICQRCQELSYTVQLTSRKMFCYLENVLLKQTLFVFESNILVNKSWSTSNRKTFLNLENVLLKQSLFSIYYIVITHHLTVFRMQKNKQFVFVLN